MSAVVGRFAPSPSGRLHLGNLACSLLAWLSARSRGGRIVLRIEDLDAERCPRKYADQLEEDLGWLGLFWDEGGSKGGPHEPYYQSECSSIYTESYKKLEAMGLVYPCFCSRSQLHAASAPHTSDGNVIYPGTCRGLTAEEIAEKRKKKAPAYRLMVPDENITFTDGCMGEHTENLLRDCGDFYLRRADGVFAYQLAVVVDDARMGVTEVVRGADLLSSTARQLYLWDKEAIWAADGSREAGGEEDTVEYEAVTGDIGLGDPDDKYCSRVTVRLDAMERTVVTLWASFDGGEWEEKGRVDTRDRRVQVNLPFVPTRHDTMRLRLTGKGQIAVRSIAMTLSSSEGGRVSGGVPRR